MKQKKSRIFVLVLCSLILFSGLLFLFSARWYVEVYGDTGFDSVLYTLLAGLDGVESDLVSEFIKGALFPTVLLALILVPIIFADTKRRLMLHINERHHIRLYPFSQAVSVICSLVLSAALMLTAAVKMDILNFINQIAQQSTIFQDEYVNPSTVSIVFPENKRNLIYIYLESMEVSFLSHDVGGGNDINAIPELYDLAEENINFSHNDSVGGFSALPGSTWTIGAMVSQTAGIPLKTSLGMCINDYGQDSFLPGVTSLANILSDNGYYQTLMVGSDANFGGRKQYYEQHGTDKIYDLFTAKEDGIVPDDYYVWWGMEDAYLYEYAKQELVEISRLDQPFAFTMLTVDTHHIGGYVCEHCDSSYVEQYENVLSCASRQLYNFIGWLQQQDFYENTTIVVTGDHPTMDGDYIDENIPEDYERNIYNCFINSKANTNNTKNRQFCTLDMFPSTLAAMGCTIEGDRLGLGTNLFSDTPTLCEELGTEALSAELAKSSDYYTKNFFFK